MSAQIYYDNPAEAAAVVPVTFTNLSGVIADPSSVTLVLTDPTGAVTNYVYTGGSGLNVINKVSVGNYSLTVDGLTISGLYSYVWVGSGGNVQQVTPGTFRLIPLTAVGTGQQYWYTGIEELKSRLGRSPSDPTYNSDDFELKLSVQACANWINSWTGRHFYQLTEARTFSPESVWTCKIDDLVSTPSVVSGVSVDLDYNGNGVYDTHWTQGTQYQLTLGEIGNTEDNYNVNSAGVPRPYRAIQVLTGVPGATTVQGGGWFPWLWPFTYLNRVKVTGTWGWPTVPPAVQQASLALCVDLFKTKDAPWGVAGTAELGVVRIQNNSLVKSLLQDYRNVRRRIGV